MTPEPMTLYTVATIIQALGGMSYGNLRIVYETLAVQYPARAVLIKSIITDILEDDLK